MNKINFIIKKLDKKGEVFIYPKIHKIHKSKISFGEKIVIFYTSNEYWKFYNYEKQWKDGLKRIKKENISCLIESITSENEQIKSILMWGIYKTSEKILAIKWFFCDEKKIKKFLKNNKLTPENCYEFIPITMFKSLNKNIFYVCIETIEINNADAG